jgi:hypothetical protein
VGGGLCSRQSWAKPVSEYLPTTYQRLATQLDEMPHTYKDKDPTIGIHMTKRKNDSVGYTQGLEMSDAYVVNKDNGTVPIDSQEEPPAVEITSEPLPRYDTSRTTSTKALQMTEYTSRSDFSLEGR